MATLSMNADACVVVSGTPDQMNSHQKLTEHFHQTGDGDSGIKQLVMLSKLGIALVEFLTSEGAADVLANETELKVRGLTSVIPQTEIVTTRTGWAVVKALRSFVHSLLSPFKKGGPQWSEGKLVAMDSEACLVLSGFPTDVQRYMFHLIHQLGNVKRLVFFPEAGTALVELFKPDCAAKVLAEEHRLLEKTGLQVRNLEPLVSPKEIEDVTALQTELSLLKQQHETLRSEQQQLQQTLVSTEQNLQQLQQILMSTEEQLQHVTAENEGLRTAYRHEREVQKISFALSRTVEEEAKKQKDTDEKEIKRLKEQIASLSTETTNSYDMSECPRGVAVIINNISFEDMPTRNGAEGDTDCLQGAFESLGFTVVTFSDLDYNKMVATMKDQGKADHSNYDCFVCCIMSHGTMGKVYSSDDLGIEICELMKLVNAKKCPSLKGKPKLFFIQACQGEKNQRRDGFDHGEHDAKPVIICHEADFFLGLATVPGYVALRDPEKGAPYVHHLAEMLKDFGPTHDLSDIMAMVCNKMNEVVDDDDEKFGWISSNHSTLRKRVVFKSK